MASQAPGEGHNEIILLERVLLKLASENTDEALGSWVGKFLCPCLLKLRSDKDGVRKKVLEVLIHVNKRVKNNNAIQLPMQTLLKQYQDPNATYFEDNFTIVYLKMGFPRLPEEQQAEMVPLILNSLEGKPPAHQNSLILMLIPMLGKIIPPEDVEKKRTFLGLQDKPVSRKLLTRFLLHYLLLQYGFHPRDKPQEPELGQSFDVARFYHPCMSENDWKRVSGEAPIKAEHLERNKVNVIKFLGMSLIDENEISLHLVIGTSDTRHSVVSQAETVMRKFNSVLDWDNPDMIKELYNLIIGDFDMSDSRVKPEDKVTPANTRICLKLVPILLKSRQAAVDVSSCLYVTELLFSTKSELYHPKLISMNIAFMQHVLETSGEKDLNLFATAFLNSLLLMIKKNQHGDKIRAAAYVVVGKIGLKLPQLVNTSVYVIDFFFDAMSKEDKETQLSVQEAMSMMAPAFKQMDKSNLEMMEALLNTHVDDEEPQVRKITAQYAGEIFSVHHVASRYILLLGAGDSYDEVANTAKFHLYKYLVKYRQENEFQLRKQAPKDTIDRSNILPDFFEVLKFVIEKAEIRLKSKDRIMVGDRYLPYAPSTYSQILNFLRTCLLNSSGVLPQSDSLEQPHFGAPEVTKYLKILASKGAEESDMIRKFVSFAENLLHASDGIPHVKSFLQIFGCTLEMYAEIYESKLSWFKGLLDSVRDDVRESVAEVISLITGTMNQDNFERSLTELSRSLKEKSVEMQHGLILTLGFCYGRKLLNLRVTRGQVSCDHWDMFKKDVGLIVACLDHQQSLISGAACSALGEIGRNGPLPLKAGGAGDEEKTKFGVVQKLLNLLKTSKAPMKNREKAAIALGQMCLGDTELPHRKFILTEFLAAASDIKDLELDFSMGEGYVYTTLGPLSPAGRDFWLTSIEDFRPYVDKDFMNGMIEHSLDELCKKYTQSSHPNVKQASCLWLLALTKDGHNLDVVRSRLLEIQSAFMSLLGDTNDLVQDAASKGLGLVYDHSDEKQQNEMVNYLLKTLTDGKRDVQKVTQDTKIFEEGQMGKAPTGENLSTYKELCSLATDLNQPDLVYKFMHLANYNAMWNSRKGAAFGFSSIAAKAGEQMEPHLPKIVPKLYRYQFDPTPKIQESMTSIWNCLIPESTKTIDKYMRPILVELNANLTSNQWRVRESCCNALQDLLRGRTLEDCLDILPDLWKNLFRVMDDIKETVRLSASKACSSLSRTCIRMCDVSQGAKASERAVSVILTPILENGLQSPVNEVRAIALNTVVKVTKIAGIQLKPHLHFVIPALLEAASELESKDISYVSVRMANDPSVQEKIDLARISAAKSSPMIECVNFVLQFVDGETLEKLVPRLIDLIKGNVGIATKGTTSDVIVSLTHHCPLDLQPFTGKILAAFVNGLADRNRAVRKTYASSIGHLMKTAKDTSMEKLFIKLRTWYLEKTDDSSKQAVVFTFDAVNRYNPDRLKAHATQALPVVFLGMHEEMANAGEGNEILEIWEEIWSDCTPGTEGGIRLYLNEIMAILMVAVESQQWKMKSQVARSMGTIAKKLGGTIDPKHQKNMFALLLNALGGRTWDGKESILRALADVCCHGKSGILEILHSNDPNLTPEVLTSCLLRECKKEKKDYRIVALESTGDIVKTIGLDAFGELFEVLFPLIKKEKKDENDEDNEEHVDREEEEKMLDIRHAIYYCLGKTWSQDEAKQSQFAEPLLDTLLNRVSVTTRKNQLAIVSCLGHVMMTFEIGLAVAIEIKQKLFVQTAQILSVVLVLPKSSNLRKEALGVLRKVIEILSSAQNSELSLAFKEEVDKAVSDVIKDVSSDPETKSTARELKKALTDLIQTPTN